MDPNYIVDYAPDISLFGDHRDLQNSNGFSVKTILLSKFSLIAGLCLCLCMLNVRLEAKTDFAAGETRFTGYNSEAVDDYSNSLRMPDLEYLLALPPAAPLVMPIATGSLMFTHVNSDDTEGFSIVSTVAITSGTIVTVTDNEWGGASFDADGSDENYIITFTSNAPCGTEYTFTDGSAPTSNNGSTLTVNDNSFADLEAAGDALYLFDGTYAAPNFISAISFGGGSWGTNGNLPGTLTNNTNALDFSQDNGEYICGNGSLASTIMDDADWTTSDAVITHTLCAWNCSASSFVPGDIFFSSGSSDAPDAWSFVIKTPIPSGKVLYITDNEWSGTAFNTGEGNFRIVFTSAAPCGTEFTFTTGASPVSNNGSTATISSNTYDLDPAGDALYLYEGSITGAPSVFVSAMKMGALFGAGGDNLTSTGLTNNLTAIDFSNDNGEYLCGQGSLASTIMDETDWTTNNALLPAHTPCFWNCSPSGVGAGDLYFTGVNADNTEGWSFVVKTPIAAGTVLHLTDHEWSGTTFNTGASEGSYRITFTTAAPCGTEFAFSDGASPVSNNGSVATITPNAYDFATDGEALYLFEGSLTGLPTSTDFVSAIKMGNGGWGDDGDNLTGTGLANGTTAIDFTNENGGYDCANGTSLFINLIMNDANWTTSNTVTNVLTNYCTWGSCTGADVGIAKPDGSYCGDMINLVFYVFNNGPEDDDDVDVVDNFPASFSNVVWSSSIDGVPVSMGSGNINDNISLDFGDTIIYRVTADLTAPPDPLNNTATVTGSADSNNANNSDTGQYTEYEHVCNPPLAHLACDEFKIMVVLDASGSIDAGEQQTVRDAAIALVNSLTNTGASLALVQFAHVGLNAVIGGSSNYQLITGNPSIPGPATGYVLNFVNYINGSYPNNANVGTYTNWEDGFIHALTLAPADLMLFMTDGDPTAYNCASLTNPPCSSFSNTFGHGVCYEDDQADCEDAALAAAIVQADIVKTEGTHLYVFAVSDEPDLVNIAEISGPMEDLCPDSDIGCINQNPTDPAFSMADFTQVSFSEFASDLADFAQQACNSDIKIEKTVYAGHNAGAGCPGVDLLQGIQGAPITYCFTITNIGDDILNFVEFDDPALGINVTNLMNLDGLVYGGVGSWPLAADEVITYYYQTTIDDDLCNIASIEAIGQSSGITVINDDDACVDEIGVPCGSCNVINGPATVCPGAQTVFTASISGVCVNPMYTWSITGNGTIFAQSGANVTVTAGSNCNASYTVSVSIACSGCTTSPITCFDEVLVQDISAPSLTCPMNTTVNCANNVPTPAPGSVTSTDNCGGTPTVTHVGDVTSNHTCGNQYTVTRTYRATDACGNSASCTQVITVLDLTGPLNPPANGSATVSCPAQATNPGAPAPILDACGRTVTAGLIGSTTPPACEGIVIWTYRYTACNGTTTANWTFTYTINYTGGLTAPANGGSTVSCPADATNPGAPAPILDACGRTVTAGFIGSTTPPACEGNVIYTYRYTDCDGTTTANWTYTYTINYTGGLTAPANGGSTVSCPADATNPGAPAPILDACGRTVTAGLLGSTPPPVCEGTVVWTYRYTACDGTTTDDWTYTYTIDYSGGLTAPANGGSTVSCPANATNPGAPIPILDACGRTITAGLIGLTTPPACEGTIVWTYRYTACDGTTTDDWTYTYTIDYSGGLTAPENESSTVSCPAQATDPGAPDDILDACGRTVSAGLLSASEVPACEGTVVYTYRYTACDGTTTDDWTYTYIIDYSGGLTAPDNESSTVSCPAQATDPGAPDDILDACGRTVSAGLLSASEVPGCEGTVVYTYRYTACDGTTIDDWTYTYIIDYSGGLTAPDNESSTVSCPAQATDPGAPDDILDACGRTVSAGFLSASEVPACEGTVVYTYRYTACDGTTTDDWTYTYTIDYSGGLIAPDNESSTVSCPAEATDPGAPDDILDACGRTVSAGFLSASEVPACEGTVVYTYRYTACDGTTIDDWTYTYIIDYSGGLTAPDNESSTISCPAEATNPGAPDDILDACGRTVSAGFLSASEVPACEGTVIYTYRYTACDGTTTDDWTYTYTIDYSGGLIAPGNESSTVSCPAEATNPGAPDDILDACGRTVSAGFLSASEVPACEGTVVYTYRYTACDGTTTDDWTYTYTIDYSGGLTAPDNESSTVSCPAEATNPVAPDDILDACGRTVSAGLLSASEVPACEGTVIYTYRYTACDGTTTDDWTYTYTIDYNGGLTAPPNESSTVSCPSQAIERETPDDILDACGRIVNAGFLSVSAIPECEGTVVYTYRYTSCDGTTIDDWTYTYIIDYSGGLTAPDNESSTVSCPAQATDPGAPDDILDACGRTVSAGFLSANEVPACEGTVVYTYRYTACDGTTTDDWTYTYIINYSGGLTAPDNESSTVSCPAEATNPGAPDDILDACGRTVSAGFLSASEVPACEGTVVYTYRYTACDGTTTDDWTYTYTIDYSGGLTAPDNESSTVSCPAEATNPGAPDDILDACGRTVSAGLLSASEVPACEGTVVYTYRYTACDGTTIDDWTYTYIIDYSGGLIAPDNESSTVSCPAEATNPGAPDDILDACGRTVSAGFLSASEVPACEGTVVYTYRYTACDGTTTDDWTYTYTIDYSGGLTAPDNESSTVSCPAQATDPGAPDDILDACGRTVSAGLLSETAIPACEGTVVYTYRYTACDGTTIDDWTYTYIIDYSGGLTAPDNESSTVSCPAQATDPGTPADIVDACGRTVSAGFLSETAIPACEGTVVYTYRYTACDGTTTDDWTYTYIINYSGGLTAPDNESSTVSCPAQATDPGTPDDILDACGRTVSAGLLSASEVPGCEGTVVYTYRYTACDGTTIDDWTYTYIIDYSGGLTAPDNESSTVSCPAQATDPGAPDDILDACGRTVSAGFLSASEVPACEGTVVYTYRYTACDGTTTDDWTYTYTIDYSGGLIAPDNESSTVSCPAEATDPGAPDDILDACGRTVSAGFLSASEVPACEGTVVYTYRYTACDGTTIDDWTYTYIIDYSGGLTAPDNESSTISCPAEATNPGAPDDILDACGRTVSAGFLSASEVPACEGTVIYTYRYTACDGTTTDDWTYTYIIDYSGGLTAPDNESSMVSCPAQAIEREAPEGILDACGRIVNAGFLSVSAIPACEGTVVYTYRYTACDGTTIADWTYTYIIDYSGGLTAPDNESSTVSCPAEATNPVAPDDILDACGRTVSAGLLSASEVPACEGTVIYTYRYTACDGTTTDDWTYTYTIDYNGGLTAPPNESSTVSCPSQAIERETPDDILDACGRIVNAGFLSVSAIPECEGTVVYTYRYTSCDGTTIDDWTYTYIIDYSGGLTAPDNESSTVSCPAQATDPGAPDDILDACGRTVSAGFLSANEVPACEGTVVYTYRYTACDGTTTDDWTYTYIINYSGGLTAPDNESSTVSCPAEATNPGAPDDILDACGRTVSAGFLSASEVQACEGTVVYTYRYTACDGTTTDDWTYTYTIDYSGGLIAPDNESSTVSCPAQATDPGAPDDILDACGRTVSAGFLSASEVPACEGTVVYTYRYTACDGTTTDDWTYTYTIDYSGGLIAPDNESSTVSCPAEATDPGAPDDILDACGRTVSAGFLSASEVPACEGTVVYTYRYTACDGTTTDDWTYTYTIDYSGGLIAPDNESSTVSCPAQATDPGAPDDILDACGRTVSAGLLSASEVPACEGTVVYTYRYTACDGTTIDDWTYTYTIDYSGGLTAPDNESSIVSCPSQATDPGTPADIVDACGRTVSAGFLSETAIPACEGTVVYTYRYTACDETTIADWTYTYTIDYNGGLTAPPNESTTVSCPSQAIERETPDDILDACGRIVNAGFLSVSAIPECEGTVVYTYRYTACDGTTIDDWTYTYIIDYSGGLTAPDNESSTVSCPAQATDPGTPADIVDACGRTVSAGFLSETAIPACEGTVVYTYRYTACDGTTTDDWTYTYIIDYSGGLTAPPNESSTVSCPAQAIEREAPEGILDACGRIVNAGFLSVSAIPACEGTVVYTYRYTACDGTTIADWTYTYIIDYSGGLTAPENESSTVSCPSQATDPGTPADIVDACGRTVSAGFLSETAIPVCEGTVVYTYRYTACDETTIADWTYTYIIDYSGGLTAPDNESSMVSCPAQAIEREAPEGILDACGRIVNAGFLSVSAIPACEGTVVYTYRYTACDGTTIADWTYTYIIDYNGGLTAPDNESSTISCPAEATNPGAPDDILDACGRTVSAGFLSASEVPACEGTVIYTYRYTACDGTTTDDWTYTYTIDYSGGLIAPDNESSTVSCPAQATDPGAPDDILDACGRTVSAGLIGSTPAPECNGDVVWTFRYTACDGTTVDDWTYTYHVIYSGGLNAPDNESSTLSCPSQVTDPGAPDDIQDACGRTVTAGFLSASEVPACEGTVVYTYRYTACDGTTTDDWTYTYTIDESTAPLITCPADITIECSESSLPANTGEATATDDCSTIIITSTDMVIGGSCPQENTIIRTWLATDACGNSSTCNQIIGIEDNIPPVITCPIDLTIECTDSSFPEVTGFLTATDNCDNAPIVDYMDVIEEGPCPQSYIITRTWTVIDACSNSSICVQQVIEVEDNNPPIIVCPADVTIQCVDNTLPSQNGFATATDNCDGMPIVSYNDVTVAGPTPYGHTIYRTWSATDQCGYSNTCLQTITVENPLVPEITGMPNDTICSGGAVTFQAVDQGMSPVTYHWNFGSGSSPGTASGIGPHTVHYNYNATNGSIGANVILTVSLPGCLAASDTVANIHVNPSPNPAINAPTGGLCYFENRTFIPVAAEIPGYLYHWNFGVGASIPSITGYGPHMVSYDTIGLKTVQLIVEGNFPGAACSDTATISFNVVACPGSITGKVRLVDGSGIGSVNILLFADANLDGLPEGDTIRDLFTSPNSPIGTFAMTNLEPGQYVLVEVQPVGYFSISAGDETDDFDTIVYDVPDDNIIPVTIEPQEIDSNNVFIETASPGLINGYVYQNIDNDGIPDANEGVGGVKISVYRDFDEDGVADLGEFISDTLTNAAGWYEFVDLTVGNYFLVQNQPDGYDSVMDDDVSEDGDYPDNTNTFDDIIPASLAPNETDADNNFIEIQVCGHQVTNTNDDNPGSLRRVIECAMDGDTITFHPFLQNQTIYLQSQRIEINKNLYIHSSLTPRVKVSSDVPGAFLIGAGVTVEFMNIDITSGIVGYPGAAIENYGHSILWDMNFFRNIFLPPGNFLIYNADSGLITVKGGVNIDND